MLQKSWGNYLHCRHRFKVVTEHKALKWLISLSEPKGRLLRWMLEIQYFNCIVEYAPRGNYDLGRHSQLGRVWNDPMPQMHRTSNDTCGKIQRTTNSDRATKGTRKWITDYFSTVIGIVRLQILRRHSLVYYQKGKFLFVAPRTLINRILQYSHRTKQNWQWARKTLEQVRRIYWWNEMNVEVSTFLLKLVHWSMHPIKKPPKQGNEWRESRSAYSR